MRLDKGPVVQKFSLVSLSPLEHLAHHAGRQRSSQESQWINPDRRFLPAVTRVKCGGA
jgi:hypothetical protein